jgi:hypothetical protein
VLGDLFEEYALRAQTQTVSAVAWWYWGQTCRSLVPLVVSAALRGRWGATVGVAVIGFAAAGAAGAVAETLLSKLLGAEAGVPAILRACISLATLLIGGYVAARIRPRAEDVMAAIVFVAVAWMMATMADGAPGWYALAVLIVGPATAHAGGRLSRRRVSASQAKKEGR